MTALVSTTYFGPVQWYQKLHRADTVCLERHEHFIKQSYRNRCLIATAAGVQALTVPVEHDPTGTAAITDIRISDHHQWRRVHWNALATAYGESPFFDYYADDLRPFFEKRWDYLFDFNLAITVKMCELLDIQPDIRQTTDYLPASEVSADGYMADYREGIRPKHPLPDDSFRPKPYYQVYASRNGFLENLSVLDLLFNMGNEAIFYL